MILERYRLFELQEFIRRVLALNLADPVWISCELAQVRESRGHYYLELVEKDPDDDRIIAQASAVIWQRTYRRLRRHLGQELSALLQEGMAVLIQVRVEFHERYGLKFVLENVDPSYTLGQLEMRRRAILEKLQKEQLLGKNKDIPLPLAVQRIAVLSAERAAGYHDFITQLQKNPYGLAFAPILFPAALQGEQVRREMLQQLAKIRKQRQRYDAVVIIRGGGARLDLAAFDDYDLAQTVAQYPLPVLTGIGHEIDDTILDQVVHRSLKTPTAVAEFLLHHNLAFDQHLEQIRAFLQQHTEQVTLAEQQRLRQQEQDLRYWGQRSLDRESEQLRWTAREVPRQAQRIVQNGWREIQEAARINDLLSVPATLKRGFTITSRPNSPIGDGQDLRPGDLIDTRFAEVTVRSTILADPEKNADS